MQASLNIIDKMTKKRMVIPNELLPMHAWTVNAWTTKYQARSWPVDSRNDTLVMNK
jgi:hypothetical protein